MTRRNWYVLTGGPGTGKTTLLNELHKQGFKIVPEAARALIDEGIAKGIHPSSLRLDEKKFQYDVLKYKAKVENKTDTKQVTFFDRGMHDTIAYMRHYGFELENWASKLIDKARYKKIFLLEPLSDYEQDYARAEDYDFVGRIHTMLHGAYEEFGMKPILVPAMSVAKRLEFILSHVKESEPSNDQANFLS